MTTRAVLLCTNCTANTPHLHAYSVPGRTEKAELDKTTKRLVRAQVVEPDSKRPNAIEQLYMCLRCGNLRRWGLEANHEVGRIRSGGGGAGEPGGAGDGEVARRTPLVPEESVEARAARVGKGAGEGEA